MKFRLLCLETNRETGLLSEGEQTEPWNTSRKATERRPPRYVKYSQLLTTYIGNWSCFIHHCRVKVMCKQYRTDIRDYKNISLITTYSNVTQAPLLTV